MIRKMNPLNNSAESRYLVRVSVRNGGIIEKAKQIVYGPKWKAEEIEVELKKKLRKRKGIQADFNTFEDILDYYNEQHLKHKKSYDSCFPYVRKLKNDLGKLKIDQITVEQFRQYQRGYKKEDGNDPQNATLNRLLAFTKAALQFAAENSKIPNNPLRFTKQLKLPEHERNRVLSDKEWASLRSFLPEEMKPIVTFAFLVPSRTSELKALRCEWIQGDKVLLPGSKTKTGQTRFLPIPPEMKPYFDSIPEESEYVFYRKEGTQYLPIKNIRTDDGPLGEAFKKANISDFRFHDFRHTAATNLRKKGVRIELIMAIGGWKTQPTFFRYSNYTDQELINAYR